MSIESRNTLTPKVETSYGPAEQYLNNREIYNAQMEQAGFFPGLYVQLPDQRIGTIVSATLVYTDKTETTVAVAALVKVPDNTQCVIARLTDIKQVPEPKIVA